MTTWTSPNKTLYNGVDFLFSDGLDFLFSDGTDYVFKEGVTTPWTNATKNASTWVNAAKN